MIAQIDARTAMVTTKTVTLLRLDDCLLKYIAFMVLGSGVEMTVEVVVFAIGAGGGGSGGGGGGGSSSGGGGDGAGGRGCSLGGGGGGDGDGGGGDGGGGDGGGGGAGGGNGGQNLKSPKWLHSPTGVKKPRQTGAVSAQLAQDTKGCVVMK